MRVFIRMALVALAVALASPFTAIAPNLATITLAAPALLDINSASQKELEALKGIGRVRAAAIIKGRPYQRKDQLVSRGIIPQSVYEQIKDQIIARQ